MSTKEQNKFLGSLLNVFWCSLTDWTHRKKDRHDPHRKDVDDDKLEMNVFEDLHATRFDHTADFDPFQVSHLDPGHEGLESQFTCK